MLGNRLFGLDALRGIAALLVVALHANLWSGDFPLMSHSYLAVDFFFVLSGYVMARTYETRLQSDALGTLRFLRLRVKRLWPTMAVGALLGFITYPDFFALLAAVFLIPIFVAKNIFPINGVAWSIFFELFANAVHAPLFAKASKRTVAIIMVLALAAMMGFAWTYDRYNLGWGPSNFFGGFPRVIFPYCMGILLYRSWADAPPFRVPPLVTYLSLPLSFAAASLVNHWVFDLLIVLIAFPLVMAGGLMAKAPRPFIFLGTISFPLYAVHIPLMRIVSEYGGGPWLAGAGAVAIVAGFYSLRARLQAGDESQPMRRFPDIFGRRPKT